METKIEEKETSIDAAIREFEEKETIEELKLNLIKRKVKKSLLYNNDSIDDTNFNYLSDCLNLAFPDNFDYTKLALVIKTKHLPSNSKIFDSDIVEISLNGINSSNLDNYIIIEPLEYHLDNLRKIGVLDSRIKGEITLSSKAIILTNYEQNIDKYNVLKYKGNIEIVIAKLLILSGYYPQEIKDNTWINQENISILNNYLMQYNPDKLSLSITEILKFRQTKELRIRDKILSIIRKSNILDIDDIDITAMELVILAEHYKNMYAKEDKDLDKIEFTDFVNIYGVRLNKEGIYLIEDSSLLKSGYAMAPTINELYTIYLKTKKNYKERAKILGNRKKIIQSICGNSELLTKKNITEEELDKLYKKYIEIENDISIKKFMQALGIRVDEDNKFYLLNDNETITLVSFIEARDEEKIALCLREKFNEDCYTEGERDLGVRLHQLNSTYLSFDGLEDYFTK